MTIEPTAPHIEATRGRQAEEALANPLIAEALQAWEQEITEQWKTSPLRDAEGRETLRLMLEAAKAFKSHLLTTMETGKLQDIKLQRQRTVAEKVRAMLP